MIASRRPIPAHIVRPRPFPWAALPRLSRVEARLASAAAAQLAGERPDAGAWQAIDQALGGALGGAPPRLEVGPPYLFPAAELAARAAGPGAFVRIGRADGRGFAVVVDGALAARIAARVLGVADGELAAPRTPTAAERGVLAFLVAAALDARGADAFVVDGVFAELEGITSLFEPAGRIVGVEGVLQAAEARGRVRFLLPEALLAPGPLDVARLVREGGERLANVFARLEVIAGRARLPAREVVSLAPRDVVLLDAWTVDRRGEGTVSLACGRRAFAATLAGGVLTITAPSSHDPRGEPMPKSVDPALVEELPLELSCRLAEVSLSARDVLELAPGAIVPLGRPPGTGVELVSGGRVVARGELVEVEGELGVRILTVSP